MKPADEAAVRSGRNRGVVLGAVALLAGALEVARRGSHALVLLPAAPQNKRSYAGGPRQFGDASLDKGNLIAGYGQAEEWLAPGFFLPCAGGAVSVEGRDTVPNPFPVTPQAKRRRTRGLKEAGWQRETLLAARPRVAISRARGARRPRREAGPEPFFKRHEQPSRPTRGMLALNRILEGSKGFKAPPPTKDVYVRGRTRTVVHRDPLVAVS